MGAPGGGDKLSRLFVRKFLEGTMQQLQLSRLTLTGAIFAAFAAGISLGTAIAREPAKRFEPLLATTKTVMDEQIVYPSGVAKLTTGIVTLDPGDETGWHTHGGR
jgi:hypothetical protein